MSVHCVYRNSTEFRNLSEILDIHPDSLEVCVHLFQNSDYAKLYFAEHNDFPFPSEEYVREYFFGGNKLFGREAIRNWTKAFGKNKGVTYHSKDLLPYVKQDANNALRLVNKEAVHVYRDNNGRYVLDIARPRLRNSNDLEYLLSLLGLIKKFNGLYYLPKTITVRTGSSFDIKTNNLDDVIDNFKNNLGKLNIPIDSVIISKNDNSVNVLIVENFSDYNSETSSSYLMFQKPIQTELNKLRTLNHTLRAVGSTKKLKAYLKSSGVNPYISTVIMKAVELDNSLANLTPIVIFNTITKLFEGDLAVEYNKYIEKPIDEALELHLIEYLKPFNIDIKETGLAEELGVVGIFDILNKTIHLAKNRNSISMTEEFAHAFVRLMGAKKSNKEENKDYTFLFNHIENTSIYWLVYELYKDTYTKKDAEGNNIPDIRKIKEEAIGLALAVAINNKWNNLFEEKETTFWQKLKEWFTLILNTFSDTEYINIESLLNQIATEVIQKDYSILTKVDDSKYRLLDYAETVAELNKKDGGKAITFMQYFTKIGNIITGSFSYRRLGTVYRGKLDSLHDIDMKVPPSAHGLNIGGSVFLSVLKNYRYGSPDLLNYMKQTDYFKKVLAEYPKLVLAAAYPDTKTGGITINAVYSENEKLSEKFTNLSGSYADRLDLFTEEERSLIYLFDFFLAKEELQGVVFDEDNLIALAHFSDSFGPKMDMGRAKDIFDYQRWLLFELYKNENLSDEEYLLYQKINYTPELLNAIDRIVDWVLEKPNSQNVNKEADYFLLSGRAGTGKCLDNNTIIPTPNGDKLIKDIKVGDFVFDRLGNPSKVLGVYPLGLKDSYIVTFKDGRLIKCNEEHLWTYFTSKNNFKTVELLHMINTGLKPERKKSAYRYLVPTNSAVLYKEKLLPIHPYVIGAFIGDGICRERYLTIFSEDIEIVNYIAYLIKAAPQKHKGTYSWLFRDLQTGKLIKTKLFFSSISDGVYNKYSYQKFIPNEYKHTSIELRLLLLQGLMDTDGSIILDKGNRYNIRYTSTSKHLIDDIRNILFSLGYSNTIIKDNRKDKYTVKECFELSINIPNIEKVKLFHLNRKVLRAKDSLKFDKHRNYDRIGIINIQKENIQREMTCLYVDNPEHLFLCGDYIVTHNTTCVDLVLNLLREANYPVDKIIVTAIANKAVEVLKNKVEAVNIKGKEKAMSTAKALGLIEVTRPDGSLNWIVPKKYDITKTAIWGKSIIVIDEASMQDDAKLDMLLDIKDLLKQYGLNIKIIALGDEGLIAAIQEEGYVSQKIKRGKDDSNESAMFIYPNKELAVLETRMRQGEESSILGTADKYWDYNVGLRPEMPATVAIFPKVDLNGGLVNWVDDNDDMCSELVLKQMENVFRHAIETGDVNYAKIVCGHVAMVNRYNNEMYKRLHPEETSPLLPYHVGDLVMFYAPFSVETGYMEFTNFFNSTEVSIKEVVGEPKLHDVSNWEQKVKDVFPKTKLTFEPFYYLEVIVNYEGKDIKMKLIISEKNNRDSFNRNMNKLRTVVNEAFKAHRIDEGRALRAFVLALLNLFADVLYNFAISSHKSQGSTYQVVFVDMKDILGTRTYIKGDKIVEGKDYTGKRMGGFDKKNQSRMIYTAITRAANVAVLITPEKVFKSKPQRVSGTIDVKEANEIIKSARAGKPVEIPKQSPTPLLDNVNQASNTPDSWTSIQKQWDDRFALLNEDIEFVDTETEHAYYYFPNGKDKESIKADTSVTTVVNPVRNRNEWLNISSRIGGPTADRIIRDFFMGKDVLNTNYPNINKVLLGLLYDSIKAFKSHLDKVFGDKRYLVRTDTFPLLGKFTDLNGNLQMMGGTVDILVFDEDGNYYIYDIKTSRSDIKTDLDKQNHYGSLVNSYRIMLENTYPELKGKCKGLYLFLLNTFYDTPQGLTYQRLQGTTVYTYDRDLIYANGEMIQDTEGYKAPVLFGSESDSIDVRVNKSIIPLSIKNPDGLYYSSTEKDRWGLPMAKAYPLSIVSVKENKPRLQVQTKEGVNVSTQPYTKELPWLNTDTAYIFTENALANAEALGLESVGPTPSRGIILNVRDYADTNHPNQAGIRTDKDGNITPNAFGVIVKKFQLDANGRFVAKEGQFQDTDEDFELFKSLNTAMFERLDNSGLKKIVFPLQMALGKAALPKQFATWLAREIYFRYGLRTSVLKNRTEGYDGYGIKISEATDKVSNADAEETVISTQNKPLTIDFHTISDRTVDYGVELTGAPNSMKIEHKVWLVENPDGIVAYRINLNTFNTPQAVKKGIIGNPFDWLKYGTEVAALHFIDWLITGNNFGELLANEEFRLAIIEKLLSNKNPKILYYKELGYPSHATILGYLALNPLLLLLNQLLNLQLPQKQLGPETKINIWHNTNENKDLSNFADRPFTVDDNIIDILDNLGILGEIRLFENTGFKTVEGAFLAAKMLYSDDYVLNGQLTQKGLDTLSKLMTASGPIALSEGRKITGLRISEWDTDKYAIIKLLMLASFKNNPLARLRLLDTGNATLTHTLAGKEWGDAFPRILMEIRELLKDGSLYFNVSNIDTSVVDIEFHDKHWRSNPNKSNKTVRIYLKDLHEKGYFELVKDLEDNLYSVHFKTKTEKGLGLEEMLPSTKEEREILFELIRNVIPEGAKVSTWGSISEGGISGLNKLGQGMTKVGERTIDRKSDGSKVKIPVFLKTTLTTLFTPEFEAHFTENQSSNYRDRTILNITDTDITIAFAVDFNSAGERLTKKEAEALGKYYSFDLPNGIGVREKDLPYTAGLSTGERFANTQNIKELYPNGISINIAGNGMFTFAKEVKDVTLLNINEYLKGFVLGLQRAGILINEIRSGGLTGVDEAGIIAALTYGIKWSVVAPKGWKFRNSEGKDISDKQLFMLRFFTLQYQGLEIRLQRLLQAVELAQLKLELRLHDVLELIKQDLFIATHPPIQRGLNIDTTMPSNLLSDSEKELIKQRRNLIEASLFKGIELKGLAKLCMFSLSNMITLLLNSTGNNTEFFPENHPHKNTDFTGMSRIDIINTVGLNNLLELIRNRYFNKANPNRLQEFMNMGRKTLKKLELIYNNYMAFTEMAYSSLIELELVSINSTVLQQRVTTGEEEVMGADDAAEAAEIFGSSVEHWQVGFRQVSAFNSLSLLVKQYLNNLLDIDDSGVVRKNEFGLEERIKAEKVTANILEWTQGATTISEMVERIELHLDENPWLKPLIEKLTTSNDETFKSLFFSNFKKYFQPYIIQYLETKYDPVKGKKVATGRLINKIINQNTLGRLMVDDYLAKWQDRREGALNLYNSNGKINGIILKQLQDSIKTIYDFLKDDNQEEVTEEVKEALKQAYSVFDIEMDDITINRISNKDIVKQIHTSLVYVKNNLEKAHKADNDNYDIIEKNASNMVKLFNFVADSSSTTLESCSFEAGKMHYSYVTPSYTSKMVLKLRGDVKDYDAFIQKEFGYRWFLNADGSWRNELIRMLAEDEDGFRLEFKHAVVLSTSTSKGDSITYTDKSPVLYAKSMLLNFFSEKNFAWFRMPMQSNKPSEEYLRMRKYTGSRYKDTITRFLMLVAFLEIDRISTVRDRNKNGDAKIKNFDSNGLQFQFLEYLQDYLDLYNNHPRKASLTYDSLQKLNEELHQELSLATDLEEVNDIKEEIQEINNLILGKYLEDKISNPNNAILYESACKELLRLAIKDGMQSNFEDYIETLRKEGVLELDKNNKYMHLLNMDMGSTNEEIMESLENFFWNDAFASINILLLMVTDIAYYKDTEDLQKRLALLHAPGLRGNLEVKDRNGKQVTDGITRTVYLKDFEKVVSDAIENVRAVFKAKYDAMPKNTLEQKDAAEAYRQSSEALVNSFKDINVTDALGYSSLTSYRKKALIFGKWGDLLEDTYERIKSGKYTTRDLLMAVLPLKPFVYSLESHNTSGRLGRIKSGVQNKNSEYMLLMMDAILRGEKQNAKLLAIYDIMEESHEDVTTVNGRGYTRGIDTIQFESTVKAGLLSAIDITEALNAEEAKLILREAIYVDGNINGAYNLDVVHELDFEDYAILSEVPAHLEGDSIFGSQTRILAIADLPETVNGETLYITINGKKMSIREAKLVYMDAIRLNIEESFEQLAKEFKFDSMSLAEKNIALSRMLLEEIKRDSKYGYDMLYAVCTDEYGRFNIPLSDPILAGRIQSLLNSIIKSRINKLQIKGGPVVLVTNFGTAKDLEIRFKDADGNSLLTFREFYEGLKPDTSRLAKWAGKFSFANKNKQQEKKLIPWLEFIEMAKWDKYENSLKEEEKAMYLTYLKEYKPIADKYQQEVASKQKAIEYMECYAPSSVFIEDFPEAVDENGFIDINKIPKEALEIIGYRI